MSFGLIQNKITFKLIHFHLLANFYPKFEKSRSHPNPRDWQNRRKKKKNVKLHELLLTANFAQNIILSAPHMQGVFASKIR